MSRTCCVHVCQKWMLSCPRWLDRQVHLLILVAPQVLRLESRVLELELHGERAATAEADLGKHQEPAQELGRKARGQGHSGHRRVQVTISAWRAWLGGSQIGVQQGRSEAGTHSPIQVQSKDFRVSEDKQQKLGNGVSV